MELQFQKSVCPCLGTALREVRNMEQTQEIRLSDGMPDVGSVLSAWGQVIQRGKQWQSDCVSLTAGIMVWVLYAPEDGSAPRCIESWIPLEMQWDLPEGCAEGKLRTGCLTRFVDARSVSARKIMIRAGVGALAEAFVPLEPEIYQPESLPEGVELLKTKYPVRLPREAGEHTFLMEEELSLPASAPEIEEILYYTLEPEILEQRVMADKVVFRGSGNLHLLYRTSEGQVHSWDCSQSFSQYGELAESRGAEAEADITMGITSLELSSEEGSLHLKCGLVAQYVVSDQEVLEVVEDAYCPGRETDLEKQILELPVILESRKEGIPAEQTAQTDCNLAVDVCFLPDYPRVRQTDSGVSMEIPGLFQTLCCGPEGKLSGSSYRWEGEYSMAAGEETAVSAIPIPASGRPQALPGSGSIKLRGEDTLTLTTTAARGIPVVTGIRLGQEEEPDPGRPSLILKKAGGKRLWDLARECGSTVDAIRRANHLQQEPAPGQILLIPVL